MRLAVLGGSFNPIHIGHLVLADCVCRELGYDRVLFVPCFNPPHKEMADAACAEDRLKMVELAVKADSRFFAEDFEVQKKGISYTWDTICAMEKKYSSVLTDKIGLVFGFDLASHFENWKNAEMLAEKCRLILAVRNEDFCCAGDDNLKGKSLNAATGDYRIEKKGFSAEDFKFPHVKVHNPPLEISSSEIRSRIKIGKSWRYLVSGEVFEYIKKRGLYGCKNGEFE